MIYFIRHAESTFNEKFKNLKQEYGAQYKLTDKYAEYKFSPDFIDARITQLGIQQCYQLVQQLKSIDIEVVLVSPMQRTLQTCQLLFRNHPSKPKIIAEPLFKQVLSSSCDIGANIQQSITSFPDIDFNKITDRQAWYIYNINQKSTKAEILQKLNGLPPAQRKNEAIKESLKMMRAIYDLKETNKEKFEWYQQQMLPDYNQQKQIINHYLQSYSKIAIVSHSKCIKRFLGHPIKNCKLVAIHQSQLK